MKVEHWDQRNPPAVFKLPILYCYKCSHFNKNGGVSEVTDTIGGIICEEEYRCEACSTVINYWSYGGFMP